MIGDIFRLYTNVNPGDTLSMDIDLLRTFLEVRRLGSFRSAAENLHVTQAAVSQRIKHLESILNAPLFVREKNNIYPTPAGELLVASAESIIGTWNRAQQEIGFTPQTGPSLSIAAKNGVWDLYGIKSLRYIADTWSQLSLTAEILGEDLIVKRLVAQTVDLSFLVTPCDLNYLDCEMVGSFDLTLYSTRAKTIAEAALEPYVYVEWGRDVEAAYASELGFLQPPVLRTSDHLIARRFLESGTGSAMLPLASSAAKSTLRVVPEAPIIKRGLYVAWHKQSPHQDLIKDLVAALHVRFDPALDSIS